MESEMKQAESMDLRTSRLGEDLEEMDQNMKRMREMIEDRPDLASHFESFFHRYQYFHERYDHFIQQQASGCAKSGSHNGSPLLTPERKLGLHKTDCQVASSTSGGSSDFSLKEGTELSLYSSSNWESESSNYSGKVHMDAPINIACKEESESYEELLERVTKYEDKLRVSHLRLQLSEEEVARLKFEIHSQIESAKREIKMREDDLETGRRQVLELQTTVSELETRVSEYSFEVQKLTKELEVSRERL